MEEPKYFSNSSKQILLLRSPTKYELQLKVGQILLKDLERDVERRGRVSRSKDYSLTEFPKSTAEKLKEYGFYTDVWQVSTALTDSLKYLAQKGMATSRFTSNTHGRRLSITYKPPAVEGLRNYVKALKRKSRRFHKKPFKDEPSISSSVTPKTVRTLRAAGTI